MSQQFNVIGAHVTPSGMCEGGLTEVRPPKNSNNVAPHDDNISHLFDKPNEYFSAYIIPAIVILIMMLIAGLLACLLYRRRPSSKLRIGEDDRQSFRSRGIPVIFQVRISFIINKLQFTTYKKISPNLYIILLVVICFSNYLKMISCHH